MLLAARWLASGESARAQIGVATVDHGLRPDSRTEAETVAHWAAALGLPHEILTWRGAKPQTRIQERARAARYALLRTHAQRFGADYLLTAHHADDQAETILFRLIRGSGVAGLAGMQSMTKLGNLMLYRPLLNLPKKALVAYCESASQSFVRDPSNDDPSFARTRLRALLLLLDEAGINAASLARLGRRAAGVELALAEQAAQVRSRLEKTPLADGFALSIQNLRDLPEEILRRVIGAEIAAIGAGHPPRLGRLESLAQDLCAAMRNGQVWHRTLGGVRFFIRADGLLTLRREKPRRSGGAQASTSSEPCDPPSEAAMR
jgi:tRNA(Ile)-lysidine synthase